MNSYVRYTAVNTKIRVLENRFLKDEDFENILHKKNVQEVASYLKKETHYNDILNDINENDIHRTHLETLIKKDHAEEIRKLSHYFYDDYRKFFKYVFIKREIEELKIILRGIKNGKNIMHDRDSFVHIGRVSKLSIDALLSSKDIEEFIKNLRGTVYYKYLQPMENVKDDKSLFMGEMALDLAYFDIFYRNLRDIKSKKDRAIIDELQGINVDLLNIQWIYRGIKFYELPREIIYSYTIPHGKKLSAKYIKDLCYVRDIDDFQSRILSTEYNFLVDNENTKDIFMERRALRYQYFKVNSMKRKHEMNISEAIAFDMLLEYEIRDIITVIESIRYDMPVDEAKKFLIRKI